MRVDDVRTFYRYNEWANQRVFEVLQQLEQRQLQTRIQSSFPSILDTYGHIVASEWVWLHRWLGHSSSGFPERLKSPVLQCLHEELEKVQTGRWAFLKELSDETLETRIDYKQLSGAAFTSRLLDLLLHVVNHSSYHRGQLTTMLRQVGAHPVATDYIVFDRLR